MKHLVSTDWLRDHLDAPELVILDCSNFSGLAENGQQYVTRSGFKAWEKGHIPGSRLADFTTGLAGDSTKYRNTLPRSGKFAELMGELGIGADSCVVLYDTAQSMWAARVWWMLRWIGFDNAAILDGGWQSWKNNEGPISTKHSRCQPNRLTPILRSELFSTKDDIISALNKRSTCIIDALSTAQFNGEKSELGLSSHIPGAINIPAESLLDPETGCYLPKEQLATRLPENRQAHTIVYCGSGIAASSVAFAMTHLDFSNVSIYMPGLQEWVQDYDVGVHSDKI